MEGTKDLDFNEEGRKVMEAAKKALAPLLRSRGTYEACNVVWIHPITGGKLLIGGVQAANNKKVLDDNKIRCIVNCTADMPFTFEPAFEYQRHDMTMWSRHIDYSSASDAKRIGQLVTFMGKPFKFILSAILRGENVLIHCLAGAHRAGTMGVSTLMLLTQSLDYKASLLEAKAIRGVIDPIGSFPKLLELMQLAMKGGAFEYIDEVKAFRDSLKAGK